MNELTHSHSEQPKHNFDIFFTKALFGKYLMEKCLPEAKRQLFFKYFENFCFIPKLFSKV